MHRTKRYNLQRHVKLFDKWRHVATLVWDSPYELCKGIKTQREARKTHFEYYKIVPS